MLQRSRNSITLVVLFVLSTASAHSQAAITLKGAGATFPGPIYAKWFANYNARNPNVAISYEAVGSEAGIRTLIEGRADFGASDNPEIIHQLAPDAEESYLLFPSVIGAVVPIVNLPGLVKDVSFTPQALAGIFSGRIRKWNDPLLKEANHSVSLPDLDIVVIHRNDGSGTTYAWTDYLSQISPEWKSEIGASLAPQWPIGRGATGNDGVAKLVKEIGGSIGYVEFIYALQNHLSCGRVQNKTGEFITADLKTIAAAASNSLALDGNFRGSIVNAPGHDSYPIVSFTWLVVPSHIADESKRSAISGFLKWMLGPGQRQAATLGYLALPGNILTREEAAIAAIR